MGPPYFSHLCGKTKGELLYPQQMATHKAEAVIPAKIPQRLMSIQVMMSNPYILVLCFLISVGTTL